jgi:type II secretory pathway pseudopilin PulG
VSERFTGDEGTTLLELLVALTILGMAVVVIVSGMMTSIITTDLHRSVSTAESAVRSYAESTKAYAEAHWTRCPTTSTYNNPDYTPPSGFTESITAVKFVTVTGSNQYAWADACPGSGDTIQRISLQIEADTGRAVETTDIVVRKP